MEYLLSNGADPNRHTNESGDPILCGIAYFNNVECVRLLLQAGADPNAFVNGRAEAALHACVIGLGHNRMASDCQGGSQTLWDSGSFCRSVRKPVGPGAVGRNEFAFCEIIVEKVVTP